MDEKIRECVKQYPELENFFSSCVFLSNDISEKYLNDYRIEYKNLEISSSLLIDIISSAYFREKVEKLFNGEIRDLRIAYEEDNELSVDTLSRKEIIGAFELMKESNKVDIPKKCLHNFEIFKDKISYERLMKVSENEKYVIEIDKKEYEVSVSYMLQVLQMKKESLDVLCNDENITTISNMNKEYFFYALYKYINENHILDNYLTDNEVNDNYRRLSNMEIIDFEAVNRFYNPDEEIEKVKLNKELEDEILKNMPSNLNKLEKTMYIYLKMCKLLSYDEEFFFANMEASVLNKHKNIEHLQSITPENNEVVCYEFNSMYAKMLKELGINFQSNNTIKESYGTNYHTMLDFRCGKYLVSADSLTSAISGDIISVKLNGVIDGFKCKNKNQKTILEFYRMLGKVYKIVKEEEEVKYFNISDFDDSNVINKLNILIDKTNFKGYKGMDFISYVLKLYKQFFNDDERMNNIKVSIIKDYKDYLHGGIVFCVNVQGFNIGEENTYYLFDSRRTVLKLNRIELQEYFDEGIISYYDAENYELPGIKKLKR